MFATFPSGATMFPPMLLMLVIAVWTDVARHRIPNILTFGGIFCGVVLHVWHSSVNGLTASISGVMIGFFLFLPLYLLKGMRAGDVKLMAAAGAFLGFQTTWAVAYSLFAGMFMGLAILFWKGEATVFFKRYGVMFWHFLSFRKLSYLPPAPGDAATIRFPYAVAIATGSLITVLTMLTG